MNVCVCVFKLSKTITEMDMFTAYFDCPGLQF